MWNENNKSEIACVFASLILNENELEVTEDSLKKILSASHVTLESYWFYLFPKLISGIDLKDLIGVSSSSETSIPISSKENIIKEVEDSKDSLSNKESDEDMGFGLFD